jgi:hypothetical protein
MMIEVLGPGCARCNKTAEIIRKAGQKMELKHGQDFCVNKVKDTRQIVGRGVAVAPGVRIEGGRRVCIPCSEGKQ